MGEDLTYREVRGVVARGAVPPEAVILVDQAEHILIKIGVAKGQLWPSEARVLARDLVHLARRIDARKTAKSTP
jgi:hypothetical protein